MSRRRHLAVVEDPSEDLEDRRRVLTELATSQHAYDPPLPPTHPLVVFGARWNRAGGFTYHEDEAALARLVERGERWAVELGLAENLARIEWLEASRRARSARPTK